MSADDSGSTPNVPAVEPRERPRAPEGPAAAPRALPEERRLSEVERAPQGRPEVFREGPAAPLEKDRLLTTRIKDLSLRITGTKVERMVEQLYQELSAVGIGFRPICYLSDEWGCPDGRPLIGIPFYLADEKLGALEGEVSEGRETERESIMYLRHESGHAFCYAYELYKREDFHNLFGPFTRPYVDDYKVQPFSRSFVRHIPGWYAQKHPDEDFAETFAVLITPGSNWRTTYAGWPAMRKLEYVEARIREFGHQVPKVSAPVPSSEDVPVEAMEETVGEIFGREGPPEEIAWQLGSHLDGDLRSLFEAPDAYPTKAADLLEASRQQLITSVSYWTGLARPVVKAVFLHLVARCRALNLTVKTGSEPGSLARFSVVVTTLAMNRVYSGKFFEL